MEDVLPAFRKSLEANVEGLPPATGAAAPILLEITPCPPAPNRNGWRVGQRRLLPC
jgi:hypothetical protein